MGELLKHLKLPQKMHSFGCVLTSDEKHVIFLGGQINRGSYIGCSYIDRIYVMDVDKMDFKLSEIKCPSTQSSYRGVLMDNRNSDRLLVFGFMRHQSIKMNTTSLPDDIMNIIVMWFSRDWIHL